MAAIEPNTLARTYTDEPVVVEKPIEAATQEEPKGNPEATDATKKPSEESKAAEQVGALDLGTTLAPHTVTIMEPTSFTSLDDPKPISNSSDLLLFASQPSIDACVEVSKRRQDLYITTHPFSDADIQTISWLLQIGKLDGWTDKVISFYVVNASVRDYLPAAFTERIDMPIARLGSALYSADVLADEEVEASKRRFKFVIAIQSRNSPVSYKLVVSHSRRQAAVDVFYELLNGNSVVFVGAVLKSVSVPVDMPHRQPGVKFRRVESVKEAERCGEGVVGVIC